MPDGTRRRPPCVEELEPRLLLSADLAPFLDLHFLGTPFDFGTGAPGVDVSERAPAAEGAESRPLPHTAPASRDAVIAIDDVLAPPPQGELHERVRGENAEAVRELVIVDPRTPDYRLLVEDLQRHGKHAEVLVLEAGRDGIRQVAELLEGYRDLDAVHLVGHGAEGRMTLGATELHVDRVAADASTIAGWGQALGPGADLLLYGCETGAGAEGSMLVEALARLTGADVAASTDATGHAARGGDWTLELRRGEVETEVAFGEDARAGWDGVLATETVRDEFSTGGYGGNDGTRSWSGGWQELGESTDPSSGLVRVVSEELRLGGNDVTLTGHGVEREADLTGATSATLTFDFRRELLDEKKGEVILSVSSDGGATWSDLATYALNTNDSQSASFDISAYISGNTRIRFLGSGSEVDSHFFVDNVQIQFEVPTETYFLDGAGDGSDVPEAALKTTAPTETVLENFDPARDAQPGLLLGKSNQGFNETDPAKFQAWHASAGGSTISGSARLTLWSAVKDFKTDKPASITAFLMDCDANGDNCTEIASATVSRADWDTADSGSWIKDTFEFGSVNHTFAADRHIGVKVVVDDVPGADDMWLAYDTTAHPARLAIGDNAAPVLTPSSPSLTAITEDEVDNPGDTVAGIVGSSITDPDGGALEGIAVTGLSSGNGVWEYSLDDGASWTVVGTVSDSSALLLRDIDRLRFVPDGENADAADITYRAWDRTDGDAGAKVDASVNGGTRAFSSDTDTASITVSAVNDPPAAADNTVTTAEDTPHTFSAAEFGFSDVDAGDALASVTIESLPGAGSLELSGAAVSAGQVIDVADIDAGALTFTPAADAHGTGHASFDFTVSDGTAASSPANTITVDVTAVNDPPTITSAASPEVAENTTVVLRVEASDVDGASLAFFLSGGADEALFTIDPASGELAFRDAPDFEAPADADSDNVYEVQVRVDDGSGGSDLQDLAIMVTGVNEGPVLVTNAGETTQEGGGRVIGAAALEAQDVDDTADAITFTVTSAPAHGRLELTTAPGVAVTRFTQADIDNDRLVYVHDGSNTTSDTFSFTVDDSASTPLGPSEFTITVTPVDDDAPVLVVNAGSTLSDGTEDVITASELRFRDGEQLAADVMFTVTQGPENGHLELASAPGTPVTSFTQADIDAGRVRYVVDNASAGTDGFAFEVADGQGNVVTGQTFTLVVATEDGNTFAAAVNAAGAGSPGPPPTGAEQAERPADGDAPGTNETVESSSSPEGDATDARPSGQRPATLAGGELLPDAQEGASGPRISAPPTPAGTADGEGAEPRPRIALGAARARAVLGATPETVQPEAGSKGADPDFLGRGGEFDEALDRMREEMETSARLELAVVGSSVAVTTGLSVGYVLWLVRGGLLLASLLSSMPAWRVIDPLPVLARFRERSRGEGEDESLSSMVSGRPGPEARPADAGAGANRRAAGEPGTEAAP